MSDVEYEELISQPYQDSKISAGFTNLPTDNLYLRLEREGEEPTIIHLRADEMLAILYCASGSLWSELIRQYQAQQSDVRTALNMYVENQVLRKKLEIAVEAIKEAKKHYHEDGMTSGYYILKDALAKLEVTK